jgi:hypothetical protein
VAPQRIPSTVHHLQDPRRRSFRKLRNSFSIKERKKNSFARESFSCCCVRACVCLHGSAREAQSPLCCRWYLKHSLALSLLLCHCSLTRCTYTKSSEGYRYMDLNRLFFSSANMLVRVRSEEEVATPCFLLFFRTHAWLLLTRREKNQFFTCFT